MTILPSRQAEAVSAQTAPNSPIKSLQQRMPVPASPGLLGLAMAPECLTLAPPPIVPKPEASPQESGALDQDNAPLTSIRRDLSLPPSSTTSLFPGGLASPRRAHSAQPLASPRRADMPSPRRVFPGQSAPLPFNRQPPPSPTKSTGAGQEPSTSQPTAAAEVMVKAEPSMQRRSQRSARPRGRTSLAPNTPLPPTSFSAAAGGDSMDVDVTATNSRPASALRYKAPPALTPAQLLALTNKNTVANRQHYNVHHVTTIYKDENRPPSPTSKIRKSMPGVTRVPFSSSPPGPTVASSSSQTSKGSRKRSAADMEDAVSGTSSDSLPNKRPHFRGAGEEVEYESPIKSSQSREARPTAKGVKWDRELLKRVHEISSPTRAKRSAGARKVYRVSTTPLR